MLMKKFSFFLMLLLSSFFVSCSDSEESTPDEPFVISTLDIRFTLQDAHGQDLAKRLTLIPNKNSETNQIYDTWKNQYKLVFEEKRVGGGSFYVSKASDPHGLILTLLYSFDTSKPLSEQISEMSFTLAYSQLLGRNEPVQVKTFWKVEERELVCTKMEWDGQLFQAVNGVIPVKWIHP